MDELKVKVTGDNRVIYEVNPNLDSALLFFTQYFPPSAKKSYGIYETEICDYLNIKSTLKMFSEESGINLLIDDKLEELSNNIPNYFEEIKKDRITFSDIEYKLNNEKFDITPGTPERRASPSGTWGFLNKFITLILKRGGVAGVA